MGLQSQARQSFILTNMPQVNNRSVDTAQSAMNESHEATASHLDADTRAHPSRRPGRSVLARLLLTWSGRARKLCPGTSDVDFFCNVNGVVDLDAKVPDCALDLGVAQEELHGPQVASPSIDQRRLGPA